VDPRGDRRSRASARGFTLIEVLIAMSVGVLVAAAAFSMSRNATLFFQQESRVSAAQLALTLGMNRITADLQRASFLSSPNAAADPMVCRAGTDWTATKGLQSLAGVQITHGPAAAQSNHANNGMAPDQIVIGGSFDHSEAFVVHCVHKSGTNVQLQLQSPIYDGAMARVVAQLGTSPATPLDKRLATIFVPGRFVQILDPSTGFKVFGKISTTDPVVVTAGNLATVTLDTVPTVPTKPGSRCGISNLGSDACGAGLLVSVVSRVRYQIADLTTNGGKYQNMVNKAQTGLSTAQATVTGDVGRTELVRGELGPNDDASVLTSALDDTKLEIVSEYAVDLRFGLTVSTMIPHDDYNPTVDPYPIGNAKVYEAAGDTAVPGSYPQRIRAVQVRLATRTRAPDRYTDYGTPAGDGRRMHFYIPGTPNPSYARMRTGYANVALPNQGGFSMW
jgi:prepilin-type N-terminal cleavage/methylation domain-containing protein